MTTALFSSPLFFEHQGPPRHPERPARLSAVLKSLGEIDLVSLPSQKATREQLQRAHTPEMIDWVLCEVPQKIGPDEYAQLDADTYMSAKSADAALCAAGAVIAAVDSVVSDNATNAFCAVRPPGHHAERARPMGFCLFNNIAVGLLHARAVHGLKRMAVIDFDVHHGNGTQDIFFCDPDVFYASTHQMPLYPGTGTAGERGIADNVLNRPLSPGTGSAEFRAIYTDFVLPALEAFEPEFIFISAGFDGHRDDPLANLNLGEDDYGWVTREICAVASRVCAGRVVSALEGGYDLEALAASAQAHVTALTEA